MKFMFLKIMDVKLKDDIFMALQSAEINKATYFEGLNLDKVLSDELDIFRGFFGETKASEKKVVVVTAYLENIEQAHEFISLLRDAGIDIDNKEILRMLILPVDYIFEGKKGSK